ncbi:Dynamin family-domain-containing protein [Bombardia bombarda]|uniref:Dynamin family-domain-containing protein n=1 Tax=Bombardia bombarda TaxID=252184 RepID=A0AA40C1P6_9PEZI|nr:Dynamin family-domain-containing protein [Bombardia bombarda]
MDAPAVGSADLMKLDWLQKLASETSPSKLESGTEAGLQILENIKSALVDAKDVAEIARYLKTIHDIQSQASTQRTVVGVVGSTGAGKSSVINAVLDEECIVPTNCMRACTAVITEIQYNDSEDPSQKYRTEIHFISKEEWIKELRILFDDLRNGAHQPGHDHMGNDTEAGVAYSKIRSVYPDLTRDEIFNFHTPHGLAEQPSVRGLLGSVKVLTAPLAKDFSSLLGKYVDSKEKSRGRKKESEVMEFWPLIKVVKIFTRSPALASGLVLVDLPGTQDSNAARSAMAARYIEQCTGFVTVICSKTDDITATEALKSLPEDEQAHQLYEQQQALEAKLVKTQEEHGPVRQEIDDCTKLIEEYQKEIDAIESALSIEDNEPEILFSSPESLKRKPRAAALKARKRSKTSFDSDDSESEDSEDDYEAPEARQESISKADAQLHLRNVKSKKKTLLDRKEKLNRTAKPLHKEIKALKCQVKDLSSRVINECIKYRNGYSRPAIQQQFADGIRELDQDNAAQRDADSFDPDHEERDYAAVASALSVFCVSARAYQKLSGRLEKDSHTPFKGFRGIEDSGIPALQRHALSITQSVRAANCRKFLNDLSHLFVTLMMQVVVEEKPLKLADKEKEQELKFIERAVNELRKDIGLSILRACQAWRDLIRVHITNKFSLAMRLAVDDVTTTVDSWAQPKVDGGLPAQTYRATCVRDGVFKGAAGPHDFNKELSEPLEKRLAQGWERVFSTHFPQRLDALGEELSRKLKKFQVKMEQHPIMKQSLWYDFVARQILPFEELFKETKYLKALANIGQKEASRLIKPAIYEAMKSAYEHCGQESGMGCFKRIKEYMDAHVGSVRTTMFKTATTNAKARLDKMVEEVAQEIEKDTDRIIGLVEEDYKSLVVDRDIFKALTAARESLHDILFTADKQFRRIY